SEDISHFPPFSTDGYYFITARCNSNKNLVAQAKSQRRHLAAPYTRSSLAVVCRIGFEIKTREKIP
ncbi:MAG TPA: hypothetical protein VKB84_22550, partial [Candidatus Binataceae bacterium]|nr:hypothetical protein [Candidatus Binataceae bacterium]